MSSNRFRLGAVGNVPSPGISAVQFVRPGPFVYKTSFMDPSTVVRSLYANNGSKIALVVADGLGGLPLEPGGRTELESARKPHLDALARQGTCGLSIPVAPGVTPGRGVGLLALLGYDPLSFPTIRLTGDATATEELEPVERAFGMRAALLTADPVCRAVAGRLGVEHLDGEGSLPEQVAVLKRSWGRYTLFVLHYPDADAAGVAGHFDAKVKALERLDAVVPQLLALNPDVLAVTGGHSTPAKLCGPSWHPVPAVLWAKTCRTDAVREFGETACALGGLGQFPAAHLLPLLLAHAQRLRPFGG
jgi:2,3-bisphosphoglycerate-independent phosphoglycerate mutase